MPLASIRKLWFGKIIIHSLSLEMLPTEGVGSGDSSDELPFRELICLLPNVSRKDTTPEYWDTHAPAVAVFMSIFFVVALIWNTFILYCMVSGRSKLLRAPTHVRVVFSGSQRLASHDPSNASLDNHNHSPGLSLRQQ